jgi:hypothetical protein
VEDQTQALLLVNQSNLQLLDELTAEPDPHEDSDAEPAHYLDGTRRN